MATLVDRGIAGDVVALAGMDDTIAAVVPVAPLVAAAGHAAATHCHTSAATAS